jgi:TRAP-type uncharacterized transport system substrate-binding protein
MLTRRCLRTCVFALLFVSAGLAQTPSRIDCPPHEQNAFELRTAKAGLYYNLVGRAIAESFNQQNATKAIRLQAVCSQGSAENIQKLGNTTSTLFAVVQSDVAHAAWYGHPWLESCSGHDQNVAVAPSDGVACQLSEPGCSKNMRPGVITPLYTEAMHILLRPHFNISGLEDLRGRKVWAGAAGSGGRFSAERIFSTAGASFCSVDFVGDPATGGREITQDEALDRLGKMQIDAVFFTGPVPTHQLQDALDRFPEIHFFPLSYGLVHKLTLDESYTEALIRGEYYGKPDSILTVGVEALLMTNEKAAPAAVSALADFIHYQSPDLRNSLRDIIETRKASEHEKEIAELTKNPGTLLRRLRRWRDFKEKREILRKTTESLSSAQDVYLTYDEKEALKDYMESEESHDGVARLPLLDLPTPDALVPDFYSGTPVVRQYFSRPRGPAWKRQLAIALIGCILLVTSLFVWMRRKLHRVLVRYPDAVLVTIATFFVWTLGSYLLYHYEGLVNEDFNPLWKSFVTIFLYCIPFLGKTALTPGGQQTIQIVRWLGLLLVGGILSPLIRHVLTTDLLEPFIGWLQGRPIMPKDIEGHLIIINWDHRSREIIRHLRGTQAIAQKPVVVVTPKRMDFVEDDCVEGVVGVVGDATQVDCLDKACISSAHSVTILSAWRAPDPNDRRQSVDRDVADMKTIQTLHTIRDLLSRRALPHRLAVTAEIRSSGNRLEAESAGGQGMQLEIVCVDAFGNDILIQSALNPGLAKLYSRLISVPGTGTPNDMEVSWTTVPRELLGKSFGEMLAYFARRRGQGPASIPIAVCRDSQVFVNPSDAVLGKLQEADILFVISDHELSPGVRASVA